MLTRRRVLAACAWSVLCVSVAGCEPGGSATTYRPAPAPDASWPENAADAYERVYASMDFDALDRVVGVERVTATEDVAQDLATLSPVIAQLLTAVQIERCEFHSPEAYAREFGIEHFSMMRRFAMLLTIDAQASGQRGEMDACAERLAAALRVGRHVGADRLLVSVFVEIAVAQLACESIRQPPGGGAWSEAGRSMLLEAIEAYDLRDPLDFAACLEAERRYLLETIGSPWEKSPDFPTPLDDLDDDERQIAMSAAADVLEQMSMLPMGEPETSQRMRSLIGSVSPAAAWGLTYIADTHDQNVELASMLVDAQDSLR